MTLDVEKHISYVENLNCDFQNEPNARKKFLIPILCSENRDPEEITLEMKVIFFFLGAVSISGNFLHADIPYFVVLFNRALSNKTKTFCNIR